MRTRDVFSITPLARYPFVKHRNPPLMVKCPECDILISQSKLGRHRAFAHKSMIRCGCGIYLMPKGISAHNAKVHGVGHQHALLARHVTCNHCNCVMRADNFISHLARVHAQKTEWLSELPWRDSIPQLSVDDHAKYYALDKCVVVDFRSLLLGRPTGCPPLAPVAAVLWRLASCNTEFCVCVDQPTLSLLASDCLRSAKLLELFLVLHPRSFKFFTSRQGVIEWCVGYSRRFGASVWGDEHFLKACCQLASLASTRLLAFSDHGSFIQLHCASSTTAEVEQLPLPTEGKFSSILMRRVSQWLSRHTPLDVMTQDGGLLFTETGCAQFELVSRFTASTPLWAILRAEWEIIPKLQDILQSKELGLHALTTLVEQRVAPQLSMDLVQHLRFIGTVRNKIMHDPTFDARRIVRRLGVAFNATYTELLHLSDATPQGLFRPSIPQFLSAVEEILTVAKEVEAKLQDRLDATGKGLLSKAKSVNSYLTVGIRRKVRRIAEARNDILRSSRPDWSVQNFKVKARYVVAYLNGYEKDEMHMRASLSVSRKSMEWSAFRNKRREEIRQKQAERQKEQSRLWEQQQQREEEERRQREAEEYRKREAEEFQFLGPVSCGFFSALVIPFFFSCLSAYPAGIIAVTTCGTDNMFSCFSVGAILYFSPGVAVSMWILLNATPYESLTLQGRRAIRSRLNLWVATVYSLLAIVSVICL